MSDRDHIVDKPYGELYARHVERLHDPFLNRCEHGNYICSVCEQKGSDNEVSD